MRRTFARRSLLAFFVAAYAASALASDRPKAASKPPATRTETTADTYGSVSVADPYRWLEDQSAPETRAWIDAQNQYSEAFLSRLPGRDAIRKRLGELLRVDQVTPPVTRGERYFFSKRLASQDLNVLYVRKGATGKDEVLIDPHPMSPDHRTSVYFTDVDSDGKLAAYGVRVGGEDEATIHFRDVDTGKDLDDVLPRARYAGVAISKDKKLVYYGRYSSEGPRVYVHKMGADPADDPKIFGDGYGPGKIIGVSIDGARKWLVLFVSHGSAAAKTEIYVQNVLDGAAGSIVPIVNDVDAYFDPEIGGDRMYLQTNWKAPNRRVFSIDLNDLPMSPSPNRDKWKEIVPTRDVPIAGIATAGGKLFVRYLENVQSKIRILDAEGKPAGELSFPEIGSLTNVTGRWDSPEAFFSFQSFATPFTIYRYDTANGSRSVWARENVPVRSEDFVVKQVKYASKDGTSIPMFILHKKGLKLDGSHPTLLTGYGGFRLSSTPGFSERATVWVENGGVYALANLRGGGEFGEEWHQAGMLGKKQNVFDDFIAAGEYLVREKYTSHSHLAISGGSNGGLLVGAAMTQRPDLFAAVVCSYPLLDMIRYHKFLVASYWVPEYGSADNPEQFPFLYAYSPYHRVKAGTKYPAVLFVTGDSDTRVAPLHARKMTARMQAAAESGPGSGRPVILHYDTKAGHSGGSTPVPKLIDDWTDELGFLFAETGATPAVLKKAS
jgi:prolyl oligopeptidase